jgi:ADP-heptose:LPS heptosyltransferase
MSDQLNESTKKDKPIRCLVVQFARLGDTLQSLMALRAAKQLYPNLEIHFVARERFAAAAKRVSWIEEVVTFPSEQILGPVIRDEKTDIQALGDIARWVAPLVKETWDIIINWSYSESSSYLTGLLPARVKLGYSRRKDTTFCSVDGWSQYMQAVVQNGVHQNIHLTDILTTQILTALQIHFGESSDEGDAPVTSKSFFNLESNPSDLGWCWRDLSRKWIAVQLGAAQECKTWSVENWASTIHKIIEKNPGYSFVLLGGTEDRLRAQGIISRLESLLGVNPLSAKHVMSLVGETDFDLWASVISSCQWVLSCDTAAVHLASVLGTRVLNVSVGPVRWAETGPYGNGHYVVTSCERCEACVAESKNVDDHSCRDDVNADAVYAAWSYGSLEWSHRRQITFQSHVGTLKLKSSIEKVKVLRAKIRATQDGGGVFYEPLTFNGLLESEWMGMVIGQVARSWYCGWVPPIGQEIQREKMSPALIQKLRELDDSAKVMMQIYNESSLTALALNKKSARLKSDKVMRIDDRNELRDLGNKLAELDGLVERLGRTQPSFKAFLQMSKVLMHNLQGDGLADLGKESAACYRQLSEGVSVMKDWLQHSLKLVKPVVVTQQKQPEQIL